MDPRQYTKTQQQPVQEVFSSSIPAGVACMSGLGYAVPKMPWNVMASKNLEQAPVRQSSDTIEKMKDDLLNCSSTRLKKCKAFSLEIWAVTTNS
jgi:hypothetical protein